MANKKSDKNLVVMINLDRPRQLRFGHSALKRLSAIMGSTMNETMSKETFNLDEVEKIMWCGLLYDARENGEDLKFEDMERILDYADNYAELLNAMNKALDNAFAETEQQKN
jgi:hypothetical protein